MNLLSLNSLTFGKGGNGGFSPDSISGLSFWLDATVGVFSDAGTTPAADGDPIRQWSDRSSNANNFSQITAAARPIFRATGGPNSKPSVDFVSSDFLTAATNVTGTTKTVFVVMNKLAAGTSYWTPLRLDRLQMLARMATAGDVWGCWEGAEVSSGTAITSSFSILGLVQNLATSIVLTTNGTATTQTNGSDFPLSSGSTVLGGNFDGTQYIVGRVSEVIVYNAALNSTQRRQVEGYLSTKWGITVV